MKKIIVIVSVVTVMIAAMLASYTFQSENDFFNENLEALMDVETEGEVCYDAIYMTEGRQVFYCGSCSWQPGAPSFWSKQGKC